MMEACEANARCSDLLVQFRLSLKKIISLWWACGGEESYAGRFSDLRSEMQQEAFFYEVCIEYTTVYRVFLLVQCLCQPFCSCFSRSSTVSKSVFFQSMKLVMPSVSRATAVSIVAHTPKGLSSALGLGSL